MKIVVSSNRVRVVVKRHLQLNDGRCSCVVAWWWGIVNMQFGKTPSNQMQGKKSMYYDTIGGALKMPVGHGFFECIMVATTLR
jgi:hypothetical protein